MLSDNFPQDAAEAVSAATEAAAAGRNHSVHGGKGSGAATINHNFSGTQI